MERRAPGLACRALAMRQRQPGGHLTLGAAASRSCARAIALCQSALC
jgi:hypothetical protein